MGAYTRQRVQTKRDLIWAQALRLLGWSVVTLLLAFAGIGTIVLMVNPNGL